MAEELKFYQKPKEELKTRRQFVCKAYSILRNGEEEIETVVCEVTPEWKNIKDIKITFQDQSASDFPPLILIEKVEKGKKLREAL
jgi:hypothetical protein